MLVTSILTSSLFTAAVFGKIINVDVGKDGYVFNPEIIVAEVGDQVQFLFYPVDHSVTQADFSNPCNPNGGIYSGFVAGDTGSSSQAFAVDINDTKPIWLYCSQVSHCQSGMVAVINQPQSGDKTLDTFKANAKDAKTSVYPTDVAGGSFVAPGSVVISYSGPSPQKLRAIRFAHGALMASSFLVLLPLGALSMRLLSFPSLVVFHATVQLLFLTFVLSGFALGLYFRTNTHQPYRSQPHFILGTTVVVMLLLQPIFGSIHHYLFRKLERKTFVSYLHVWWGRIIFILALTNGVLGLKLANSMFGSQKPAIIAYSVVAGIMGVLYIAVVVHAGLKSRK